ncbi:tail assembly protein [Faucicola atlantae]|uniref:tail assembly protein n=1 Tax=Faucicola atlantae TaxID=34059 RepID=UPI000AB067F3|nr:tail assembly protein [Moraxella atlantae]
MKTIEFHGVIADKFGRYFELDVQTAREATYALACQLPDFKRFMLGADDEGIRFSVFADDDNLSINDIDSITDAQTIHVVPRIMGASKFDWLQAIAGAVLIGTGMWMGLGGAMVLGGAGSTLSTALIGAGTGLLIGGITGLLMPTPKVDSSDKNIANKGFGGAVTTAAQGNPVPILYGEREIGGFYASAGIYSEDYKG